jgi:hypothetical protein
MAFSFQPKVVSDGLIFCVDAANTKSYPGSGTTWTDLSKTQLSGSLTNGPTFSTDANGTIVFDGSNDHVVIESNPELRSIQVPLTILAVVKPTQFNQYNQIFSQYVSTSDHRLMKLVRFDNGVYIYVTSKSDGGFQAVAMSTASPVLNKWNFVGIIVSGTIASATPKMFLNGTFQSFSAFASPLTSTPNTTVPVRIGFGGSGEPWRGNIAYVSVYNRALSDSEVLQNYNTMKVRFGI